MRRFVRSPAAPKITMAQGGATTALSAGDRFLALLSCSCLPTILVPTSISTPLRPRRRPGSLASEQLLGGRDDPLGLKAELTLQLLERRRGAKRLHPDDLASGTDIAVPPQHRSLLDSDARLHLGRKHALPIGLWLMLENIPGRHGDDTGMDPLGRQRFMRVDDQGDLAARGNEDDLGRTARGVRHDIGAARQ